MWHADPSKLIKILLHSDGEDCESTWAEDCGPALARPGARFVRVANVPFLYAKPTYGDVIVVAPDEDGRLAWDREGVPWERIGERILEDEGRWSMILDYQLLDPSTDLQEAFTALDSAAEGADIVVEGCYRPDAGQPGRALLAVPADLDLDEVLAFLEGQNLPLSLTLVHPCPDEPEGDDAA